MTARSHTRSRNSANRKRRIAYLKHRSVKETGKGKTKRAGAARRKEQIERTVAIFNEKGTNT